MKRRLTLLFAALGLAAASLVGLAGKPEPAAAASPPCPQIPQYRIDQVLTGYGVVVCAIYYPDGLLLGKVVIADYLLGARFGVVENRATPVTADTFATKTNDIFQKRTAEEWYNWAIVHPDYRRQRYGPQGTLNTSGLLFATWSTSFFWKDNNAVALTATSHMVKNWSTLVAYGADGGLPGTAMPVGEEEAWMGIAKSPNGTYANDQNWFYLDPIYPSWGHSPSNTMAALAGFRATSGPSCSGSNWRQYAGARDTNWDFRDDRAYFLSIRQNVTCVAARDLMTQLGATSMVQFDGGGSGQMYARTADGRVDSSPAKTCIPYVSQCRQVPVVFAIYEGNPGS